MSERSSHGEDSSGQRAVCFAGTGVCLPKRIMSNVELEAMVDTSDDWILSRTGVRERRIASEDQTTSDMASEAARCALADAGVDAKSVGLVLVATSTPDMLFPSTGCLVQHQIGATQAISFDLEAACSGFLYALEVARRFIQAGSLDMALVIGAEKMTSVVDWKDRTTCALFGDGAGAAVLRRGSRHGIIHTRLGSDGALADLLEIPAGGSRIPASHETVDQRLHFIKMSGKEVFRNAVSHMSQTAKQVLEESGLSIGDIKLVVPHQANARIIKAVGQRLGAEEEQLYMNVDKYGNTSAASVILALHEACKEGKLEAGDRIMIVVFGAGFTWGASIVEWGYYA